MKRNDWRRPSRVHSRFSADHPGDYFLPIKPGSSKISVDYAIMEKASEVLAVKAEFDWDDVGSWTALPDHLENNEGGSTLRGEVVEHASTIISL